jgi:DNA-binding transcriptional LysR family regulator
MEATQADGLWSHVHLLSVIAQAGSFTLAAQRLALSKAAVSQRLAELERQVGLTLVQRTTRSVRLTEAGQRLVDDTAGSFAHIARSIGSARDLAGQPRGLVRLTAPVALGRQQVAPTLEAFFRDYPEVRVEMELSDRVVNLAQEGFDLAVRHTSAPPDNHVARCWSPAPATCAGVAHRHTRANSARTTAWPTCAVGRRCGASSSRPAARPTVPAARRASPSG